MNAPWRIWIDTGGTFTDCLAWSPDGALTRLKVLSASVIRTKVVKRIDDHTIKVELDWPVQHDIFKNFTLRILPGREEVKILQADLSKSEIRVDEPLRKNPDGYRDQNSFVEITSHEEVPVLAARLITETSLDGIFPPIELKLGSTKGTNALLERKGANTAFLITKGFRDLLVIGDQQRPDLFTLNVIKSQPLYTMVEEVDERMAADGGTVKALTADECSRIANLLKKRKIDSVAVALINSYKNPGHELQLATALASAGVKNISLSHQLSSQIKILPRAETTVMNAYLKPVMDHYLSAVSVQLQPKSFQVMSSAGGLMKAGTFQPKDSLLSGPAGGVMGANKKASLSGVERIITFDMGGTSTDVSLCNGRPDYRFECKVGDAKILSPAIAIETIAAGGGSICDFDGFKFTVGPHSAGASPGPACYGAGGPLTLTDVNLLLGRLDDENFPIPIKPLQSRRVLEALIKKVKRSTGKLYSEEIILESFLSIANEKMAGALRKVSIQRGYNPGEYALLSFGGAGGQHACSLASMLGIHRLIVPFDAGLLSAFGIGNATAECMKEGLVLKDLVGLENKIEDLIQDLFSAAKHDLVRDGYESSSIELVNRFAFARFRGQETSLEIEFEESKNIFDLYKQAYQKLYGHWIEDREVEIELVRIKAVVKQVLRIEQGKPFRKYNPAIKRRKEVFLNGKWKTCPVFKWEELQSGAIIKEPALIISRNATLFLESGWTFTLDPNNNALIENSRTLKAKSKLMSAEAQLELFTNRFTSIAYDMGAMLQRTAFSVNIKERLDFSCALLDANGNLIVNAPHIPVHLGSLGVCVREVAKYMKLQKGDIVITNHPAFGGSHLPDITLIKPVFIRSRLMGYVANRAHHAEIGGSKPGSMPSDATFLTQEGVVIEPTYLVHRGKARWNEISDILLQAKYPTRALPENLADLNAAVASLTLGEQALVELCKDHGEREVEHSMTLLRKHASALLANKIKGLAGKKYKAIEYLDDGAILRALIYKKGGKIIIDFTGSSPVHKGNLNATKAIVNSVVLYVLRLWVNEPVPLNEGLMQHVKLTVPPGMLNPVFSKNPDDAPAVVGGNTEISQRLTDTLLKALGLSACSQGTMNNFLFGNERFGYYETIGGGTGAGNGFNGTDAVHQHMTNTRITDVEIMEWRYPVRVERFEIRKNSGGQGKWKGGDGIVREVLFFDDLEVNVLTQHRVEMPYGMKGGMPGQTGSQVVIRKNGKKEKLKPVDGIRIHAGDRVVIQTPGGGGWGKK